MSLLTKNLLLGAVPAIIAVGIALVLDYGITRRQFLDQIERNHNLEIMLDTERVRSAFNSYVAQLQLMTQVDEIRDADVPEIRDYLRRRRDEMKDRIERLYFMEVGGTVHTIAGDQFDVQDRAYYSKLVKGELIITRLLEGRDTGANILLIVVPMYDSSMNHRGGLSLTIREDQLTGLVSSIDIEENGKLALVDSENQLIVGNVEPEFWSDRILQRVEDTTIRNDGVDYILNVREVPDTDWRVMIAYPHAKAYGALERLTWTKLGGIGVGIGVAFFLAGIASARTLGPLKNIMQVHRRYASGDTQARVINRPRDELGDLADSFNQMADQLSKAQWQRERDLGDLELSERRFRQIFESAGDAIFLRDRLGKIVDANHVACESLGYTRGELLELGIPDIYNQWTEAGGGIVWQELVERQITDRKRLDGTQRRKDGSTFAVEIEASRIDQEGQPLILTLVRNVQERKEAELEIRKAKDFAEKVIDTSPGLTFIVDLLTSEIQFVNEHAVGVFGYTSEEIQQGGLKLIRERLHPDYVEAFEQRFKRWSTVLDDELVQIELQIKDGSGDWRWLEVRETVFQRDHSGNVRQIIGTVVDVTQRNEAVMALRTSETQYRSIFEAAANGFLLFTMEGKLVEANPAACQMRGYTREELLTLDPKQFVHPDWHHVFFRFLETVKRGERFESQSVGLRKDGSQFAAIIVGVPYQVGDQAMALASVVDITERQKAEAERESLIHSLEAINNELQQFTYTVSHDLKSPLITIKGFMGILAQDLERGDAEAAREDLAIIDEAAEKMKQLLEDLLELSRIGRVVNPYSNVALADVVDEVTMLLSGDIERRQVDLSIDIDCTPIPGDRLRLRQVIQNLLDNAIKYGAAEHPVVLIEARETASGVRLTVEDNGRGISPQFTEKIFGLFEKLEPDSDGSGIGLSICQRIIEHHGGRIGVEPGLKLGGARFYFEIPRIPPHNNPV
ncbi:MAG: PAS domain S-box protein [Pirellulaceae bacterium]